MNKFEKILNDFMRATEQLGSALDRISNDELLQAGCIQYFEFCFELAWKTIKAAVADQGLPDCYSPKSCLKQAFAIGWIQNEEVWLMMLDARNRMSHTYDARSALDIYRQLPEFLLELKNLADNLQSLLEC